MGWVKLDDKFPDHPKVLEVGPAAAWLYVCGLAYCNRMLTDGLIPAGAIRRMADVDDSADLAARLVAAGMWAEAEGGYQVHDYLDYQPSRAQVEAERAHNARRVADWRERHPKPSNATSNGVTYPKSGDVSNGVCNAITNGVGNGERNGVGNGAPVPGPVPVPPSTLQEQAKASDNGRVTAPAREGSDPLRRREPEEMAKHDPEAFARLWRYYGKLGSCDRAAREWDKLRPSRGLMEQIKLAIDRQRAAFRWGQPGGQAQPYLSTWLHGHQWHIEPIPNKVEATV